MPPSITKTGSPTLRRGYVDSPWGQLHYAEQGSGPAVLLLHQSPRSWDEFRELLPLLGATHRAIAVDMLGFGASAQPPEGTTIRAMSRAAVWVVDALGVDRFAVLGHHTGGLVSMDVAAHQAPRITAMILSAPPWPDQEYRAAQELHPVDHAEINANGSHLQTLWDQRAPYYPHGRPDLLERYVHDSLTFGLDRTAAHRGIIEYQVEEVVNRITSPVLILSPDADPFSVPRIEAVRAGLAAGTAPSVEVLEIAGGAIPVMEQLPEQVACVVQTFLDSHAGADGSGTGQHRPGA